MDEELKRRIEKSVEKTMNKMYIPADQAIQLPPPHENRMVCPKCFEEEHPQGEPSEVFDCKVVFVEYDDDGKIAKTVGQCCCWSSVHGVRKEE